MFKLRGSCPLLVKDEFIRIVTFQKYAQETVRKTHRFDGFTKCETSCAAGGGRTRIHAKIAHSAGCSKIRLMKPFKKCHTSGFTVSFMHFLSQLLLLLSQP